MPNQREIMRKMMVHPLCAILCRSLKNEADLHALFENFSKLHCEEEQAGGRNFFLFRGNHNAICTPI